MTADEVVHLLPYLASLAISAAVGAYCRRRRSRPGAGAYAAYALGQAACTVGFLLELVSPGLVGKLFWDNVQFLTYAPLPVALLAF
ncbi:MAG TPA: histidine kinase N-terminal 7TM domain-containing protein, partial [Longimicrobiaceae bacterium]|nr:histidine kinase N-terminal 7TM domain-containing protein [Longimicrobiaceae bacterium]